MAVNACSLRAASRRNRATSINGWHLRDQPAPVATRSPSTTACRATTPLVGDWDGDGQDGAGIWEPLHRLLPPRRTERRLGRPRPGLWRSHLHALAGDWNGDGIDTIGVWDPASATFRTSATPSPAAARRVDQLRRRLDFVPVVGDWDGNGTDTIGVWDPASSTFHLRNSLTPGSPDRSVTISNAGTIPVVGDLDGDGIDTVGLPYSAGRWRIATANVAAPTIQTFTLGAGIASFR